MPASSPIFTAASALHPYLLSCVPSPMDISFHGIPLLTHTLVRNFPPLSLATAFGNLDTLRKGIASTRLLPPLTCLSADFLVPLESSPPNPSKTRKTRSDKGKRRSPPDRSSLPHYLLPSSAPVDPLLPSHSFTIAKTEWSSVDLTGRFPVRSYDGHEYILAVVHHGYIRLTPLKNRSSLSYISGFKSVVAFFSSLSYPLTHLILDKKPLPTSQPTLPLSLFPSNTFLPTTIVLSRRNGQSEPPRTILSLSCLPAMPLSLPIVGLTYSPNPN
jgi:hypothetical protein